MLDETESSTDTEHTADTSSWEERQLCPDGNCVGVIGPDGRCKECGLAASENGENGVSGRSEGHEGSDGDLSASGEAEVEGSALGTSFDEADDLADRRLCPDGSCLGLLGEDGRCKICGQVGG
jgi:hypothetical protein